MPARIAWTRVAFPLILALGCRGRRDAIPPISVDIGGWQIMIPSAFDTVRMPGESGVVLRPLAGELSEDVDYLGVVSTVSDSLSGGSALTAKCRSATLCQYDTLTSISGDTVWCVTAFTPQANSTNAEPRRYVQVSALGSCVRRGIGLDMRFLGHPDRLESFRATASEILSTAMARSP